MFNFITETSDPQPAAVQDEILKLGRLLGREGFADMNVKDIEEVIQAHDAELSIEELRSRDEENSFSSTKESENR